MCKSLSSTVCHKWVQSRSCSCQYFFVLYRPRDLSIKGRAKKKCDFTDCFSRCSNSARARALPTPVSIYSAHIVNSSHVTCKPLSVLISPPPLSHTACTYKVTDLLFETDLSHCLTIEDEMKRALTRGNNGSEVNEKNAALCRRRKK